MAKKVVANSDSTDRYVTTATANATTTTSSALKVIQYSLIGLNILVRAYSSLYMIISDCDETFNYWEPLNLLLRGFGKQTWEYSPEYAIRAYTYLIPYYVIGYPVQFVVKYVEGLQHSYSLYQFYAIRIIALCGFTSYAEIKLTRSIDKNLSSKVANWFLFFSSIAPGMAHAGVALLPSTFAMQCNAIALSYVLQSVTNVEASSSIWAITWFLLGGIIGWPFALALGLTFGVYTLLSPKLWKSSKIVSVIIGCSVSLGCILSVILLVDSYFYSKFLLVPLNIVFYNVFGGEGEGPEIFGVEPFSYYILNLLVNFNIVAVLGYLGAMFNPITSIRSFGSVINISIPLIIWSFIFFSQPHKEERFLYPIYPLITLNAALLVSKLFGVWNQVTSKLIGDFRARVVINRTLQLIFGLLVFTVSVLRIVNLVENYSAPLQTFEFISSLPPSTKIQNVCIGKEWYHFPNSFFLPDNYRLKFVRSGFDGLLPGDFNEELSSLKSITSHIPSHMNNKNQFEADKVIEFGECDYYIDNTEETSPDSKEPRLIQRSNSIDLIDNDWKLLGCHKIIDPNGAHSGIGRLIYIPNKLRGIAPYNVQYLDFCALARSESVV